MKISDYKSKLFLRLYKKKIEFFDMKKATGYPNGYEKYFREVLRVLQPDLSNAFDSLNFNTMKIQKEFNLLDNIYVMWWQGIQNAPILVKNNIKRMQEIFGKDSVHVITEENWKEYCNVADVIVEKFDNGKISIAALSDIIRFNLLRDYGGLWVDSTVILSNNCKNALSKYSNKDFFTISNLDQDYHYISRSKWTSWFIGGKPSYPLFNFAVEFYNKYFQNHDFLIDYYTIDDLIAYFYLNNKALRHDLDTISNDWHPYLWNDNMYNAYNDSLMRKFSNNPLYSIQKLTYKYDQTRVENSQILLHVIIKNKFRKLQ